MSSCCKQPPKSTMANTSTRNREWIEPNERQVSEGVLDAVDGDALLAQIMVARGMTDPDQIRAFIDPGAYEPSPPEALPDLVRASQILESTIKAGKRVLIWGDFDVDGQTATALLLDGIRRLGGEAAYYIPNRATESHGIKVESLKQRIAEFEPGVLVTCDTGVTEFRAVEYANSVGIPVIITDHHDLDTVLPSAEAVINPKRLRVEHALRTLPGVGVAFKLMQHLYTSFEQARELPRLLDLVALGIVADIAEQVSDTRYLLQTGIERLRRAERVGIEALLEVARISRDTLTAEQISYQIGPRLNAAGRIGDPALAIELLTTRDRQRAYNIAQQLDAWNSDRKQQASQIEAAVEALIEQDPSVLDYAALVLFQPGWNAALLGPIANRFTDRYYRPVIVLTTRADDAAIASGSARSPAGTDIHTALNAHADLLRTFGGHAGAAGLSLDVAHIDILRQRLSQTLIEMGRTLAVPPVQIDAVLTLSQLETTLVHRLERLAPFGEGNPKPVLETKDVRLSHAGVIGRDGQHVKLAVEDMTGNVQHILWWGGASQKMPEGRFDVAYTVGLSDYSEFQAVLVDYHETDADALAIETPEEPAIQVEDWRREPDLDARLAEIIAADPTTQVWAEAYARRDHPEWRRRAELTPTPSLVIYTTPSDAETFEQVLQAVKPEIVHLFAIAPPLDGVEAYLRQLVIAARNAIEHLNGEIRLDVLCGATAQSPRVIRAGLEYLMAEGQIAAHWDKEMAYLAHGDGRSQDKVAVRAQLDKLKRAYEEVEAYRRLFRVQTIRRLFPK
jgi:single-stranded-DNA-specific exonuclease